MPDSITSDSPQFMRFIVLAQDLVTKHFENDFPTLPYVEELHITQGKRYISVWAKEKARDGQTWLRPDSRGRIYCFVDKTNGDILKPASWKAPAKHARGNVHDENPVARCTHYGPEYLK